MIGFATHRPAVVWAMCVALVIAGSMAFSRLPLATRTTVELPRLQVGASMPGASPEVVESYLTSPLEAAVQGVRGVRRVNSNSYDDFASLTVELDENVDVQMTRLAILERIELLRKELAPGVYGPTVANYVPHGLEEAPLMSIVISGPYTAGTLQQLLDERVTPRLSAVSGVAGVQVRGGTSLGVSLSYDPVKLRRLRIAPQRLSDALQTASVVQSLGTRTRGNTVLAVVLKDQPSALAGLEALPVGKFNERVVHLGELATARADEDAHGSFFRINGELAVAAEVTRHPGADAIRTAVLLRRVVTDLAPTLPPLVRLRIANDESSDLARELADLTTRGAAASGAVLLVLVVMLRRWRAVTLVMGSTLVAIAATALTLFVLGIPANLLTLAGLGMGFGVLVQNALVVVQRLGTAPDTRVGRVAATRQIAPAVIGSTLTTAVVLLPFLFLQGDARAAFVPFAAAFVGALAWSVFAALLIVPALGAGVRTRQRSWPRARALYAAMLVRLLRWRIATLTVTLATLGVLTWGFMAKVPSASFGSLGGRRTTLSVSLSFPRGSDPQTLDAGIRDFERLVLARPEVEQVRSTSGGRTSAQMVVSFTRHGGNTIAPLELQELVTQRAVLIGGATVTVVGEGPAFSSGGSGAGISTFRLRVRGFSYDGVGRLAADLQSRLTRIPRVKDVRISAGTYYASDRGRQVTILPQREVLARFGVTAQQLGAAVAREVRGPAGRQLVEIGGDELPVTVKAAGAQDRSVAELQGALVPNAGDAPVRIGDLAEVSERDALGTVAREDQQYVLQVSYDFRGPPKLANRTHKAFVKSLAAPAGYTITDLSNRHTADADASVQELWLVFSLGIALVVLAVALVFDSVWGAAMVLLSLPLSLAGVEAAFWLTHTALTREAAVGVILVIGLAVNHAILMVHSALLKRRTKRDTRSADNETAALNAGELLRAMLDRSGMIVVVTLASLASLLPLSIGTDTDGLVGSIALATVGGTVAGTLGVLFVLPALLVGRRVKRTRTTAKAATNDANVVNSANRKTREN